MEQKELKIVPPEGYEIDSENSTFECIKFKKKDETWRFNAKNILKGYYIDINSEITSTLYIKNAPCNHNIFATEKQAKSALAMAQISQIMANDPRFGGVVTDEEWKNMKDKFVITKFGPKFCLDSLRNTYHFLAFHTKAQRNLFLKENEDLVRDFLMID